MQTIEWIQLGATIGTAVAAIFAYKSAKETQKSNQAQIVVTITGQYSAQQMKDAIEHLCSWKRQNEKDFALQYQLGLNAPTPGKEALQLDDERRLYAHHFNQIRVLVDCKAISKSFVLKLITPDQINVLLDIVEPLEKVKNKDYDKTTYDMFRKLFRKS